MKRIILPVLACLLAFTACNGDKQVKFDGACDVGSVSHAGTWSFDAGKYTISAAGLNLWANTDAFYFIWKKVSGDFEFTGDFDFEGEGVNPHRKVGFMIRETLDPDSRYADIALHGDGLTSLQYRETKGDVTLEKSSEKKGPRSVSFRRERGRIIVRDGFGEIPAEDDIVLDIEFPQECYVGLFLCSHEEDVVETAYATNVTFRQ